MLTEYRPTSVGLYPRTPSTDYEFESLIELTMPYALGIDVPTDQQDKTLELFTRLRDFHFPTAAESLVVSQVALDVGRVIQGFYVDPEVSLADIWSVSLLHDVGKITLPELVEKSEAGLEWNPEDRENMKQHSAEGGKLVRLAGLGESIARMVEENHHKQVYSDCYGVNPELNNRESIGRNCVYSADYYAATFGRKNTGNRDLSIEEKLQRCVETTKRLFDDYTDGRQLVGNISSSVIVKVAFNEMQS